jgi:YVTN family beta-propeller protein
MKNKKVFIILSLVVLVGLAIGINYYFDSSDQQTDAKYLAYIPNVGDGTVSIINTSKLESVDTIKVGEAVSHGIATTPDGLKMYTGDLDNGKVFVYNVKTKELIKKLDTGKRVHGIDITPNGKYVLLASGALEVDDKFNYIQIVDTRNDEVIKTIKSEGQSPAHIDFTKDSRLAFVSNVMSNDVSIIDINRGEIIDNIKVGIMPNESELSPDDKFLYVANVQEGSISVVDVALKKQIAKIKVSPGTHGVAVSGDGKYVWTTNRFGQNISVVDVKQQEIVKSISIEGEPNHVSISPDGKFTFVTNLQTDNLMVIDTDTYEVIDKVKLGSEPHEIDFIRVQ